MGQRPVRTRAISRPTRRRVSGPIRADAEATTIYASAYNQSSDARGFYEFMKTMETLSKTTDESTSILLSTEGEFYRYLNSSGR